MASYFRVEINGNAQNCAKLISELRSGDWNLSVDQEGYLVVSELEWERLEQTASTFQCTIDSLGQVQQAA